MFLLPRSRICPVIHLYRVDSWPFVFCFGSESNTLNSVARGFSCLGGGSAFRRCRCPFDALRHCGILHTHSFIRSFARSFTHFICYFPAFPALRPGRSSTLPGPALESAGRFSKSSLPWPEGGLRDPGLCARSGLAATRSLFCKGLSADRAQRCVCVY